MTPLDDSGKLDPKGRFIRSGASTIYREQGNRLIAVKFSVRERDLAGAVAEAQDKTKHICSQRPTAPSGAASSRRCRRPKHRLMFIIPLSLGLILLMLYLAFHSLLDAFVVLSNVVDCRWAGIWALLLTGTHFSISAAVGFISLFGVAIMDGLLMISYFNQLRSQGLPLRRSDHAGRRKTGPAGDDDRPDRHLGPAAGRLVDPHRRPDAAAAGDRRGGRHDHHLFLTRYLMPVLYSFYGHREPPAGSGSMAH